MERTITTSRLAMQSECSPPARSGLLSRSLVVLGVALIGRQGSAADTVEPFDRGATDLELYVGIEGLGQKTDRGSATYYAEVVAGYGLFDRVSTTVGATLQPDGALDQATGAVSLTLFGTPLDTDHVDLDLLLTGRAGGPRLGDLQLAPGIELNVDSHPDMSSWGAYARLLLPLYRSAAEASRAARQLSTRLETALGTYLRLAGDHQLLLELDMTQTLRDPAAEGYEIGALSLGYNVALSNTIELITQLSVDIPQADQAVAFGFTSGLIASLPPQCRQGRMGR